MALALSSFVKNHAVVGESGNKNLFLSSKDWALTMFIAYDQVTDQNANAIRRVRIPVMIISL
jgi:hypothetical protein